jgi:hypothetical protein
LSVEHERRDHLSGTPRGGTIDRWIYVFTVASFIAIVFAGFIPDSLAKMAAVDSGLRPPFPAILHVHAVLMGVFLVLLLAQSSALSCYQMARDNGALHVRRAFVDPHRANFARQELDRVSGTYALGAEDLNCSIDD